MTTDTTSPEPSLPFWIHVDDVPVIGHEFETVDLAQQAKGDIPNGAKIALRETGEVKLVRVNGAWVQP